MASTLIQQALYIDTRKPSVYAVPTSLKENAYRLLIAYSGYARQLTATGFNQRVQECQEAARELSRWQGGVLTERLSDISEEAFHRHKQKLSPQLYRRANHFFLEFRISLFFLGNWYKPEFDMTS